MISDLEEILLLLGEALATHSLNVDLNCSLDKVLEVPRKGLADLFWQTAAYGPDDC
jgi:hypothetical protein